MLTSPIDTLKKYIDQPSGSFDTEDVAAVAAMFQADFESLGFQVQKHQGPKFGPALECTIGTGEKQLMLLGHMDTVFPHALHVPFHDNGNGTAMGSGVSDMKGGIVIMLYALQQALSAIDLSRYTIRVLLNPDEEAGSCDSEGLILQNAAASFGVLSFEPSGVPQRLTCARKGVTNLTVSCTGIPGHAGAQYKECASAIQNLCAQLMKLYTLRDDTRDLSFNAGVISGGTAENVVAPSASCKGEFRYYDQRYQKILMDKIVELCSEEPVPGCRTTVAFGASHPAIDLNPQSQVLLEAAQAIAREQGRELPHERVGGAGDIAIAGQTGVGVLDGLGMPGGKMHTVEEYGVISLMPQQIDLSAKLIQKLCC